MNPACAQLCTYHILMHLNTCAYTQYVCMYLRLLFELSTQPELRENIVNISDICINVHICGTVYVYLFGESCQSTVSNLKCRLVNLFVVAVFIHATLVCVLKTTKKSGTSIYNIYVCTYKFTNIASKADTRPPCAVGRGQVVPRPLLPANRFCMYVSTAKEELVYLHITHAASIKCEPLKCSVNRECCN